MAFSTKKPRVGGAHAISDGTGQCDHGMSCGARDTPPRCGLTDVRFRCKTERYPGGGGLGGGSGGAGSDSDDDDGTKGLYAGSGEGSMGLEADAGTIF